MSLNSEVIQGWTFVYDTDTTQITPSADGTHTQFNITWTDTEFSSHQSLTSIYAFEPWNDADSFGLRQTVEFQVANATSSNWQSFTAMLSDLDMGFESDPAFHPAYAHWHNVTADNFPDQTVSAWTNTWSQVFTDPTSQTQGPSAATFSVEGNVPTGSTVTWGTPGERDLVLHQLEHAGFNDSFVITMWANREDPPAETIEPLASGVLNTADPIALLDLPTAFASDWLM
jgi:hypothetical protein